MKCQQFALADGSRVVAGKVSLCLVIFSRAFLFLTSDFLGFDGNHILCLYAHARDERTIEGFSRDDVYVASGVFLVFVYDTSLWIVDESVGDDFRQYLHAADAELSTIIIYDVLRAKLTQSKTLWTTKIFKLG